MRTSVRDAPRAYRWLRGLCRAALRVFFRSVEVSGVEHLPAEGGGLMVAWHPNGVVDGMLLLAYLPRPVVLGARHGLFRTPVLGWFLRRLGAVPLYRRQDLPDDGSEQARREANARSLGRMAEAVGRGAFSALFPEGRTHDEPGMVELKSGAARLFYDVARATPPESPPPVIVPVGLHYDKKNIFGSRVLVTFHPPMELSGDLAEPVPAEAPFEAKRAQAHRLTEEIERVLVDVVLATESWEIHQLLHRVRKLVRAERSARVGATLPEADMEERVLGYHRVWEAFRQRRENHPEEIHALLRRVARYDRVLRALGLDDRELDQSPGLGLVGIGWRLLLQGVLIYLVLPPLLILGMVVNLPVALLLSRIGRLGSRHYKGEASVAVLTGMLLFPLAWAAVAALVGFGVLQSDRLLPRLPESAPWVAAAITFVLSGVGGAVALEYHRLSKDTRRAIRVRLTRARRRRTLDRMLVERARLHDEALRLAEGLDLPGEVGPKGRIVRATE